MAEHLLYIFISLMQLTYCKGLLHLFFKMNICVFTCSVSPYRRCITR